MCIVHAMCIWHAMPMCTSGMHMRMHMHMHMLLLIIRSLVSPTLAAETGPRWDRDGTVLYRHCTVTVTDRCGLSSAQECCMLCNVMLSPEVITD